MIDSIEKKIAAKTKNEEVTENIKRLRLETQKLFTMRNREVETQI